MTLKPCIKCNIEKNISEFRQHGVYENNICNKCTSEINSNRIKEKKLPSKNEVKTWQTKQSEKIEMELIRTKWNNDHNSITESEAIKLAGYDVAMYHKPNRILKLKNIKSKV